MELPLPDQDVFLDDPPPFTPTTRSNLTPSRENSPRPFLPPARTPPRSPERSPLDVQGPVRFESTSSTTLLHNFTDDITNMIYTFTASAAQFAHTTIDSSSPLAVMLFVPSDLSTVNTIGLLTAFVNVLLHQQALGTQVAELIVWTADEETAKSLHGFNDIVFTWPSADHRNHASPSVIFIYNAADEVEKIAFLDRQAEELAKRSISSMFVVQTQLTLNESTLATNIVANVFNPAEIDRLASRQREMYARYIRGAHTNTVNHLSVSVFALSIYPAVLILNQYDVIRASLDTQTLSRRWGALEARRKADGSYGVYTRVAITAQQQIVEYKGALFGHNVSPPLSPFVFPITSEMTKTSLGSNILLGYMDCTWEDDTPARLIDTCDAEMNARLDFNPGMSQLVARATRAIEAGEEICVDYGTEYWNLIAKLPHLEPTGTGLRTIRAMNQFSKLFATDPLRGNVNLEDEGPRQRPTRRSPLGAVKQKRARLAEELAQEQATTDHIDIALFQDTLSKLRTDAQTREHYNASLHQIATTKAKDRSEKASDTSIFEAVLSDLTHTTDDEGGAFIQYLSDLNNGIYFSAQDVLQGLFEGKSYTRRTAVHANERIYDVSSPSHTIIREVPEQYLDEPASQGVFTKSFLSVLEEAGAHFDESDDRYLKIRAFVKNTISDALDVEDDPEVARARDAAQKLSTATKRTQALKKVDTLRAKKRASLWKAALARHKVVQSIYLYLIGGQRDMTDLKTIKRTQSLSATPTLGQLINPQDVFDDNRPYACIRFYDDINYTEKMIRYSVYLFRVMYLTYRRLYNQTTNRVILAFLDKLRKMDVAITSQLQNADGGSSIMNKQGYTFRRGMIRFEKGDWVNIFVSYPHRLEKLENLLRKVWATMVPLWHKVIHGNFTTPIPQQFADIPTPDVTRPVATPEPPLVNPFLFDQEMDPIIAELERAGMFGLEDDDDEDDFVIDTNANSQMTVASASRKTLCQSEETLLSLAEASYPLLDQYNPNLISLLHEQRANGSTKKFAQVAMDIHSQRFEHSTATDRSPFHLKIRVKLSEYTNERSRKTDFPERDLSLLVYIPQSMTVDSYWTERIPLDGSSHTASIDIKTQVLSAVDSSNALVGFQLQASTAPTGPNGRPLPYMRTIPLADGRLYVKDLMGASKDRHTLILEDTAYPKSRTDRRGKLLVKVETFDVDPDFVLLSSYIHEQTKQSSNALSSFKNFFFSSSASGTSYASHPMSIEEKYHHEQTVVQRIVQRFFEHYTSNKPYKKYLYNIHVPRFPAASGYVPASLFFMDLPYGYTHLAGAVLNSMMLIELEMDSREFPAGPEEWISIVERQFESRDNIVDPRFTQAIRVLSKALCLFANLCEYKTDFKLGGEVCERFIDISLTLMGDCEDLAKYGAVLAYSLFTLNLVEHGKRLRTEEPLVYWMARCLQVYVPFGVEGCVTLPSQSREAIDEDTGQIVCHVYAMLIPRLYFIERCSLLRGSVPRYVSEVQGPIQPWEASLELMTLEGTTFANPYQKPMDNIDPGFSDEIVDAKRRRKSIEKHFRALKMMGIEVHPRYQHENNPTNYEHLSDFYREPVSLWSGVLFLWGVANCSDLTFTTASGHYGVAYKDLIFKSRDISLVPTFLYTDSELRTCYDVLKRTVPYRFSMDKREAANTFHRKTALRQLEALKLAHPMRSKSYILYKCNHSSKFVDNHVYDALKDMLAHERYGIKGFDYGFYRDMPQELELLYFKLFY